MSINSLKKITLVYWSSICKIDYIKKIPKFEEKIIVFCDIDSYENSNLILDEFTNVTNYFFINDLIDTILKNKSYAYCEEFFEVHKKYFFYGFPISPFNYNNKNIAELNTYALNKFIRERIVHSQNLVVENVYFFDSFFLNKYQLSELYNLPQKCVHKISIFEEKFYKFKQINLHGFCSQLLNIIKIKNKLKVIFWNYRMIFLRRDQFAFNNLIIYDNEIKKFYTLEYCENIIKENILNNCKLISVDQLYLSFSILSRLCISFKLFVFNFFNYINYIRSQAYLCNFFWRTTENVFYQYKNFLIIQSFEKKNKNSNKVYGVIYNEANSNAGFGLYKYAKLNKLKCISIFIDDLDVNWCGHSVPDFILNYRKSINFNFFPLLSKSRIIPIKSWRNNYKNLINVKNVKKGKIYVQIALGRMDTLSIFKIDFSNPFEMISAVEQIAADCSEYYFFIKIHPSYKYHEGVVWYNYLNSRIKKICSKFSNVFLDTTHDFINRIPMLDILVSNGSTMFIELEPFRIYNIFFKEFLFNRDVSISNNLLANNSFDLKTMLEEFKCNYLRNNNINSVSEIAKKLEFSN